jgi:26S proteasome regulatory subunit N7
MTEVTTKAIPNLNLAQKIFGYKLGISLKKDACILAKTAEDIRSYLTENNMAPLYKDLINEFNWPKDLVLLEVMENDNEKELSRLTAVLEDAIENLGETEMRDAMVARAEYLCFIGNKDLCLEYFEEALKKSASVGLRLDIVFSIIRTGFFYMDHELITKNIKRATNLVEEGGDWDKKNRLKVYQGLYKMSIRDFSGAALLFLDTVSTFVAYEVLDYDTFMFYTALCSLLALDRVTLSNKLLKCPELVQASMKKPLIKDFMDSYYGCKYSTFFSNLEKVEQEIKYDRYLNAHYRYYVRGVCS